ncbi:MAG: energy transducer TonB [Candidatus Acidiferrales bacterium]
MADSVQCAQPRALEIPVTLQGSTPVEGSDRRELFIETTKTTLVLDNGAVVGLKSKVLPGQCLFLRNDQSGREILCKVLESRQVGQMAYTDLEFTVYDPDFWSAPAELPAASQHSETPEIAPQSAEAAAQIPNPAPPLESNAAASAAIPAEPSQTIAAPPPAPVFEATVEAPSHADAPSSPTEAELARESSLGASAEPTSAPTDAPENKSEGVQNSPLIPEDSTLSEMLAALLARGAGQASKRKSTSKKRKGIDPDEATEVTSAGDTPPSDAAPATVLPPSFFSKAALHLHATREYMAEVKPVPVAIAAALLLVAFLTVSWQARRYYALQTSAAAAQSAAVGRSAKHSLFARANSSQTGVSANAAGAPTANAATSANAAAKAANSSGAQESPARQTSAAAPPPQTAQHQQASITQAPPASAAKNSPPAAAAANSESSRGNNAIVVTEPSSAAPRTEANQGIVVSDRSAPAPVAHRRSNLPKPILIVPAQIVSQAQPPIPPWAKSLDVNQVVQLDALIDANGNVVKTRMLTGSRLLQHAAENAVALWIFQPRLEDGKPTPTHMVLTVQFQR